MHVMVQGRLTNYRMSGRGRVIVLLHGWGSRASDLHLLEAELSRKFQVVIPDLPGFGGTESPVDAWGLSDYAEFTRAFLGKINASNVYAIIGHSNGGAIAIKGVADGVLNPEKLVLLASAGIRNEKQGKKRYWRTVSRLGRFLTKPLPKHVQEALQRRIHQMAGSDAFVAPHLYSTFKRVVTEDVQTSAKKITVPTVLIYGDRDTDAPARYGERFHELIKHSRLTILAGAGHFVFVDRPGETLQAIEEFLA